MARKVSEKQLQNFLNALDWSGHVEVGDNDRAWLALQIFDFLNPQGDKARCEVCGLLQLIVLRTPLGRICEDCIDNMQSDASEIREEMEGAG